VDLTNCAGASNVVYKGRDSGRVVAGDWDQDIKPLLKISKVAYSVKKWTTDSTWEQVGAYDYMMQMISKYGEYDGCFTLEDVSKRYQNLDRVFKIVSDQNRISPTSEYRVGGFGEVGGMMFHVASNGAPLFGLAGHHRLAMAIALKISYVPAVIGVVHPKGLSALSDLRCEKFQSQVTQNDREQPLLSGQI
jgi:hypothetical protein